MKKKVLIMAGYYVPSIKGGGPIQSIKNLVDSLSDKIDFYIVAADRDLGDSEPFSDIKIDEWVEFGKAKVFYTNPSELTWQKTSKIIKNVDCDAIYLNSFFSFKYSIVPMLLKKAKIIPRIPVVIAPRGEFSPGALELKSKKKTLYLSIAKALRIYNDVVWHGTAEIERTHIKQAFSNAPKIIVANNLTPDYSMLNYEKKVEKKTGELEIIFVSRIHPKKNLIKAIELLKKTDGKIKFNIYGPIEDKAYWEKCEKAVVELPPNIKVLYKGILGRDQIRNAFMGNHIFLFPTLGENFGHVISEALIGGCPVIISDQTPWTNLEKKSIGWDIPLKNDDKFIEALNYCVGLDQDEYETLAKRAFTYGKEGSENLNDKKDTMKLFNIKF
ncbi:glycosyltransferase family 4 protein [Alkalihalobacillus sp. MEB130]|uniref:glycosyltransferase family 4 protein n=1 Tax=Alkalihalobacillus sp. MEB130 TaxID=2976704 RepID=UPI0028DD61B5|nr:glycosyltransferase family 4 protein [Alkalihalobacillus sp. MEB130]MDT8860306.1 glycosyltransferase family 4 protein [Alkalihalobacillus sp. MEB130]